MSQSLQKAGKLEKGQNPWNSWSLHLSFALYTVPVLVVSSSDRKHHIHALHIQCFFPNPVWTFTAGTGCGYLHTNTSAPHPILIVKHSPCGVSLWAVEDLEASPDTDQHYRAAVSSVVGTGNFCLILFLHGFLSVLQWWLNSKSKSGQISYSSPKCSPSTLQQEQLKKSGN